MVKSAHCNRLVGALALLSVFTVHARDLAAYKAGDTADEDIITPVALDVIDAEATITRRAEEALKTPAIFRSYPQVTNAMAGEVTVVFGQAHSNFMAGLQETFKQTVLDEPTIGLPNFNLYVASFNQKSKSFPVNLDLARRWARGDAGLATQSSLVGQLVQTMRHLARPDDLPGGFTLGDTVRLVPVRDAREPLTLTDAEQRGKLATRTSIATLTRLRELFRQNFPANDQSLAQALAVFLRPNCEPDADLTRQARDREVSQLVVASQYDAGQMIVRRGQTIDSKTQAVLAALNEKLLPGQLNQQIAAARELAQQQREQAQREHQLAELQGDQAKQERERARLEHEQMLKAQNEALTLQSQAQKTRTHNEWLLAALLVISAFTLLVFRQLLLHRRKATPLSVRAVELTPQNQPVLPVNITPHLTQALKDAVVQEFASQRGALLAAQQVAAAELAELARRLEALQVPMAERIRAYEQRIAELEKELAEQSKENRELLKLKIEMTRRQLETERSRMNFN